MPTAVVRGQTDTGSFESVVQVAEVISPADRLSGHEGPSLAIDGDHLHLTWTDAKSGVPRVQYASANLENSKFEILGARSHIQKQARQLPIESCGRTSSCSVGGRAVGLPRVHLDWTGRSPRFAACSVHHVRPNRSGFPQIWARERSTTTLASISPIRRLLLRRLEIFSLPGMKPMVS